MQEAPYSNREIDRMMNEINNRFDTQDKTLEKILVQTYKTNGRVTRLEGWKNWGAGAIAILVIIVIPLIVFVFQTSIHQLQTEVNKTTK